ncbi:MAG: hypothetical protein MIO92_07965 [Methanosarcinaceae archaeon]|nr:hypothetical protein [Methanosarcinaceae archaeon]
MELKLMCCICREQIGRFDPEDVKLPLLGSMFKPIDDIHGYPPPFDPNATYDFFHCFRDANPDKTRRHRPFPSPDAILTDKGLWEVGGLLPGHIAMHYGPIYEDEDLEKEWNQRQAALSKPEPVKPLPVKSPLKKRSHHKKQAAK